MQRKASRTSLRCARIAEELRKRKASSITQLFAHLAVRKQEFPSSPMTTALYIAAIALQSKNSTKKWLNLRLFIGGDFSADFSFGVEKVGGMEYNV